MRVIRKILMWSTVIGVCCGRVWTNVVATGHIKKNAIPSLNLISFLAAKTKYVTCGSVLKLLNTDYRVRLHSHDVKYGTGSGQQSVTGTDKQEDVNSHWTILASQGKESCERGEPIKCGDTIRLLHIATRKNLHSHFFQSPLTRNQEISCYGENGIWHKTVKITEIQLIYICMFCLRSRRHRRQLGSWVCRRYVAPRLSDQIAAHGYSKLFVGVR